MARRRLVTHVELPARLPAERLQTLDGDVRQATSEAKVKIEAHAQRFTTTGWTLDDDSWEMVLLPEHRIAVTATVSRSD